MALPALNAPGLTPEDEIDDWRVMRDYCGQVSDDSARGELIRAIHSKHAYRVFKCTVLGLGLEQEWAAFRNAAVRRIASEWLRASGIEFSE